MFGCNTGLIDPQFKGLPATYYICWCPFEEILEFFSFLKGIQSQKYFRMSNIPVSSWLFKYLISFPIAKTLHIGYMCWILWWKDFLLLWSLFIFIFVKALTWAYYFCHFVFYTHLHSRQSSKSHHLRNCSFL